MDAKYNKIATHGFRFRDIIIIHRLLMNRDFKLVGVAHKYRIVCVKKNIVQYDIARYH